MRTALPCPPSPASIHWRLDILRWCLATMSTIQVRDLETPSLVHGGPGLVVYVRTL